MISSIKHTIIKSHLLISLSVANFMKILPNVTFSFKFWLIYKIFLFGQGKIIAIGEFWVKIHMVLADIVYCKLQEDKIFVIVCYCWIWF